jgi:hypothetical protein
LWPIQFSGLRFNLCRIFFSSLALCNTSFFTQSVQMKSSILL